MAEHELAIVALRAIPVRVGRLAEFRPRTAKGGPDHSEYAVLEVETAGGAVGVGEVTAAPAWNGEDAVGSVDLLVRVLAPALLGLRADRWDEVAQVVDATVRGRPFLRAGIEMACLDAEGLATGRPVAELLGGTRRRAFATKFVLPARDPDAVGEMAASAVRLGATALKVKVGLDLDRDLRRVRSVRAAAGTRPVSIDANEGWSHENPRGLARALRLLGLAGVEQPYHRSAVLQTAELRLALQVPVVADESVWDLDDVAALARSRAFSTVALYPGKVGGLRRCLRLAAAAEAAGLDVTFGSNLELGVGAAAMAHTMAAVPQLSADVASDLIGPLYFESALVDDASFVGFGGAVLPDGPGLGVRLDHGAVATHALPAGG